MKLSIQIPRNWSLLRIEDICSTFKSGFGITSNNIFDEGDYPVYGGNGLRGYTATYTHEGNYVLIGRQGALCGNITLVSGKCYVSEHAIAVQTNGQHDLQYLAYNLSLLDLNRFSESSAQPGLSVEKLLRLKLLLPPLPEQRKIALILSTWDRAIEKTEQLIAQKQQLKKGLMQQLLTGKVRFKEFVKSRKMKKTKLGMVPVDWAVNKLVEVAEFLDGERKPLEESERNRMHGQFPYYGATGIIDFVNDYIFDENIILLGEDGANIISRNQPLVYQVSGKVWVNNHAHVIRAGKDMDWGFLAKSLDLIDYRKYNSGTAQPKLNKQACEKIELRRPHIKEQRKIDGLLSKVTTTQELLQVKLKSLKRQKVGLMQQLLTGKVRVKI